MTHLDNLSLWREPGAFCYFQLHNLEYATVFGMSSRRTRSLSTRRPALFAYLCGSIEKNRKLEEQKTQYEISMTTSKLNIELDKLTQLNALQSDKIHNGTP